MYSKYYLSSLFCSHLFPKSTELTVNIRTILKAFTFNLGTRQECLLPQFLFKTILRDPSQRSQDKEKYKGINENEEMLALRPFRAGSLEILHRYDALQIGLHA